MAVASSCVFGFLLKLVWIYLCILKITAVNCPRACTCSGAHNLTVDCSGRHLVTSPVTSALTFVLDLSNNSLGPIINTSFVQMANLTTMDLSRNGLTRLLSCTFSGMFELTTVRLRNNRLTALPDSLFADANKLQHLDLSNNRLAEIPDYLFRNTPELRVLDVSNNLIGQLRLGAGFQIPRRIQSIDVSHNLIGTIQTNSFEVSTNWETVPYRTISLAFCRLASVEAEALATIPNVNSLDLSGNTGLQISHLSTLVKTLENKGLEKLSVAFMNLTSIETLFNDVTQLSLQFFNVSFNNINDLPASVFANLRSLRILDLTGNGLSTLTLGFSDLVNLQVLNISRNRLETFHGQSVANLSNLQTLDISGNRLGDPSQVNVTSFASLKYLDASKNRLTSAILPNRTSHLQRLDYSYNKISVFHPIEDATMLEFVDFSNNELFALPGLMFKGAKFLKLVNFSSNHIRTLDHGAFLPQSSVVIDLSYNFLKELSYSNWVATQKLCLRHNNLTNINNQAFYGMTGLKELDLSQNKLASLHDDLLQYLTNLRHLNLSYNFLSDADWFALFRSLELMTTLDLGHNRISHLQESFFLPLPKVEIVSLRDNYLRNIVPGTFKELNQIKYIDLSNNPFDCSCEGVPLRDWLRRAEVPILGLFDVNSTAYRCRTPRDRAGIHVTQWNTEEFECDKSLLYIIIFCSTFVALALFGLAGGAVYKQCRKWRIKKARRDDDKNRARKVGFARLNTPKPAGENHKRNDHTNRRNSYISWLGGAQRQRNRDRSRHDNLKDTDKERIIKDDKHTGEESDNNALRHYETVKRSDWIGEDGDRQRKRDRDETTRRHTPMEFENTRDRGDDRSRSQRLRDSPSQHRYFPSTDRLPSHYGEQMASESARFFIGEPRFREGPYIISAGHNFPNRWESQRPWEGQGEWHSRYYPKPGVATPRDRTRNYNIHNQPLEVHFDGRREPQRYTLDGPDPRIHHHQRSRSYHHLPDQYLHHQAIERRQYEGGEPSSQRQGMGHRAASQPYMRHEETSAML